MKGLWVLIIFSICLGCTNVAERVISQEKLPNTTKVALTEKNIVNWKYHWEDPEQKEALLANPKVHHCIKEALRDSSILVLTRSVTARVAYYSQIKSLGDINNDGVNDSIVVIPELFVTEDNSYEDGYTALFTSKEIPRIRVGTRCLGIDDLFPVADIDEDGVTELGEYANACTSRYKGLHVLTLQNNQWIEKGGVTFDTWFPNPPKEERIVKTGINTFKMREITKKEENDKWVFFTM